MASATYPPSRGGLEQGRTEPGPVPGGRHPGRCPVLVGPLHPTLVGHEKEWGVDTGQGTGGLGDGLPEDGQGQQLGPCWCWELQIQRPQTGPCPGLAGGPASPVGP